MEYRYALGLILRPDLTLVRQNDATRNGQADPHALLLGREERFEDFGKLVRRNPRPGVGYGNDSRFAAVHFRAPDDGPSVRYRSHRVHAVHDQINDDLLQLNRIALDPNRFWRRLQV